MPLLVGYLAEYENCKAQLTIFLDWKKFLWAYERMDEARYLIHSLDEKFSE